MMSVNPKQENRDFNLRFLIIFLSHVAFFTIAYFFDPNFLFGNNLDDETVKILKSAVRVDIVGMPKYTFQELKALEKALAQESGESGDEDVEKKQADQINKDDIALEKSSKVDLKKLLGSYGGKKIKSKKKKKNKNKKIKIKDLKSLILEGNKISSGSSIVGDNSTEIQTEFGSYVQTLPDLVRAYWRLPSYLKDQELNCRIRIYVDAQGRVIRKTIATSSGNDEFDQKALGAIESASPFPLPNKLILRKLVKGDVYLGFPL